MKNLQLTSYLLVKYLMIPPNIGNKARKSSLSISIQHPGYPSQYNKTKKAEIKKEGIKLDAFRDSRVVYIINPKESTEKLLEHK